MLIFVHVPRTGGTSLIQLLMANFPQAVHVVRKGHRMKHADAPKGWGLHGRELKFLLDDIEHWDAFRPKRPPLQAVAGHLAYGLHDRLALREIEADCQYVTVLRDPVSRAVSLYSMLREKPVKWDGEDAPIATGDPICHDWYERYGEPGEIKPVPFKVLLENKEYRLCNDMTRIITGEEEATAEQAIEMLQSAYKWVTLPSLEKLNKMLKLKGEMPHVNKGAPYVLIGERPKSRVPEPYKPTRAEIKLCKEANDQDMKLYEWAKAHEKH